MTQFNDVAIVFDCGATNVRVIAMDTSGCIVAQKSMANETDEDPHYAGGGDTLILFPAISRG